MIASPKRTTRNGANSSGQSVSRPSNNLNRRHHALVDPRDGGKRQAATLLLIHAGRQVPGQDGAEAREPKVVTVFSPKGGVGTSTVAVNLACALSTLGRRVALMDGNISFGNVGVFLNLPPSKSILQLVGDPAGIGEANVEEALLSHPSGLKVLLAPIDLTAETLREYIDRRKVPDLPVNFRDRSHLDLAAGFVMHFVRIGANVTEVESARQYVDYAKQRGMAQIVSDPSSQDRREALRHTRQRIYRRNRLGPALFQDGASNSRGDRA